MEAYTTPDKCENICNRIDNDEYLRNSVESGNMTCRDNKVMVDKDFKNSVNLDQKMIDVCISGDPSAKECPFDDVRYCAMLNQLY